MVSSFSLPEKWKNTSLIVVRNKWDNVYTTLSTAPGKCQLKKRNHLEFPVTLTSGYRIKEEVIILVIEQTFIECLLCATQCLGAGKIKSSVCTLALTRTVSVPLFLSLMLTSPSVGGWFLVWDQPWFSALYIFSVPTHSANRAHI